jgi:hypothetical protein
MRVPGMYKFGYRSGNVNASHDPDLHYQIMDTDGSVKTFYNTHESGNRRMRRSRQQHHPFFTKTRTGGRDWQKEWEARS